MTFPIRQIRAVYDNKTIRVYQAYNDAIANSALANGTFISPPFKMERMTWIKPSFLWMMYRSGWAKKDAGQNRILAIDISREGFEWALDNSLLSNKVKEFTDREAWLKLKNSTPVRIQWDPERDIYLQPLEHRAIQIGLSNEAVDLYVNQWVQKVTDVTELAAQIKSYVDNNQLEAARTLLPNEVPYNLNTNIKNKIMAD
ncbi:hypothetical protein A7985_07725 [Pseudoalteromonas luteoviolacea]|uniref:DUF4291 domain-containing protein n=1 Tax=Pseudoalteromonas luteoviolacea TaxID=43657 RepID=A0A1C0TX00_9GAMM|nr:DUF4291 domain-containing protein [Pseudoalteromonas luteoviolacea]OCQ23817.1 hypothetical protein A7985_07725 [Pseudoalteromonas luteoviolacea]